ncbi:MAG: arginine deiminase family protein [Nitrospira sp.]|nr:arginine deiminase family protein [Nitrospira sp.]
MIVLTRWPACSLVNCEVAYVPRERIDWDLACRQHEAYCQALRQLGAAVEVLPSEEAFPDSVFIEDNAVILDELAMMTSMGTPSRQGEPALLFPVLARYRRLATIPPPATIEGGDVLRMGKTLYIGVSTRTNREGVEALRAIVEPLGYQVTPVGIQACLHLKTACTSLDDETLLVNPDWIDSDALGAFRLLHVPAEEPFGANVLRLPGGVLVQTSSPLTRDVIESQGFAATCVDLGEFAKADAGLTCLSLLIE